jgi:hypothetical protein
MRGRANQTNAEHQEVDLVSSTYRLLTRRRRRRVRKTGLALGAIVAMDAGSESPAGARTPFLGNRIRQFAVASGVGLTTAQADFPHGTSATARAARR